MSLYNGVLFAAPPPQGVVPDLFGPYESTELIVCIGIFMPLAIVTAGIRLYTRTRIVGNIALDDYLMLAALCCSIALSAFILDMLRFGLGKNMWDIPLDKLFGMPNFLFLNLLAAINFCAATGFAKASILLFYRRIFPSKVFHWVIWFLVGFTIAYSAACVFVNIFSCTPVRASWEVEFATVTGNCINRPVFYFAQAGLGILTDFATLIAPLPVMWNLRLPLKQKLGVIAILAMGGFVCVISIIRLYSISVLLRSTNLTKDTPPALMWCVIELNMSIVGGCVATIQPFLRKHFPRILGTTNAASYASTSRKRGQSYQLGSMDKRPEPTKSGDGRGVKGTKTTINGHTFYNSSEECIIASGDGSKESRIVRTVQFGTSYDDQELQC